MISIRFSKVVFFSPAITILYLSASSIFFNSSRNSFLVITFESKIISPKLLTPTVNVDFSIVSGLIELGIYMGIPLPSIILKDKITKKTSKNIMISIIGITSNLGLL